MTATESSSRRANTAIRAIALLWWLVMFTFWISDRPFAYMQIRKDIALTVAGAFVCALLFTRRGRARRFYAIATTCFTSLFLAELWRA